MGNFKLIVAIVIVLGLIGGLVFGFWYMQNNSKQAEILQEEMEKIAGTNFIDQEIDMQIKATGDYGKVEEAVKEYLNNIKTTYNELKNFGGNADVTAVLSAENIQADEKELTVVEQKVNEYKQKLESLTSKVQDIASEATITSAIQGKDLKSNYVDVYKNIMLNEAVEENFKNAQEKIENVKLKAEEKIEGLEKVVEFLKVNAKYWNMEDGKLQFNNVNKLGEYYQLLNGASSK